jgi:hypothetical protein
MFDRIGLHWFNVELVGIVAMDYSKTGVVCRVEFLIFFPGVNFFDPWRGPPFFLEHRTADKTAHGNGGSALPGPPTHLPDDYEWFFIIATIQT